MTSIIDKPIYVTQPSLPPLDEFIPYLEAIWASKMLTNGGPFHQQLEAALCQYLGVPYISLFNNGTIALMTALQALGLKGEVITTPFTFIATANAITWNGLEPVFVDVDPNTCNLDPSKIEAAITPKTTAILPVHCYGTPCDVEAIDAIAKRHGLKVIYDAAHAFGVKCHCGSVLNHGDLSILSFHATKVFNTFEGGAIVSQTLEMKRHIDQLKNFGMHSETRIEQAGLNGKMSEINAAFGMLQLKHVDGAIEDRSAVAERYRSRLQDIPGLRLLNVPYAHANHGYFPVFFDTEAQREVVRSALMSHGITPRRYFFPLLTDFTVFSNAKRHDLHHSHHLAGTTLCMPIYPALNISQVNSISKSVSVALTSDRCNL